MKPLFKTCYELDKRCYDEYNLTEDILMEHASMGMEKYIRDHFKVGSSVLIVCGFGNNGADGITLARLIESDYRVMLYIPFGVKSQMAKLQLDRVERLGVDIVSDVREADIIVDAIFGAGLSRELDKKTRELIVKLETLDGFKIACDIPTGIDVDGNPLPIAFIADVTITMGALKEALYSDMAKDFVGEVICVDLGVSFKRYTQGFKADIYLLEENDSVLPNRDFSKNTHKGTFGHLAVIMGERDGAGVLCASSALRFGAGLVSVVGEMFCSVPSSIMHDLDIPQKTTAIALGMGFGDNFYDDIIDEVLEHNAPIVLDADIFKSERLLEFLEQKERDIVLTPHPKEFVTLWNIYMKESIDIPHLQANRFDKVREFCLLFPHVTLVLKGANMIIAQNDKLFVNSFGTSKLSKGGSGDVLTGLIASLLAQGWSGLSSAISGSLALTKSASLYNGADFSMLPTDLIDNLSKLK